MFLNKKFTQDNKPRAYIDLYNIETLWFNTGTLCNLSCKGCYIESSPTNKSLEYISYDSVKMYIQEIIKEGCGTKNIGFTGGEPFMNPEIIKMLQYILKLGFNVLVLSNGMRPIELKFKNLLELKDKENLTIRISIDHYTKVEHEKIRGRNTWDKLLKNLVWLENNGFNLNIACRIDERDTEKVAREKFQKLFNKIKINIDASDSKKLILFPNMDQNLTATEITQECWKILNKNPRSIMCSNSRMVVKKSNEIKTKVLACTLITKDKNFELGHRLMKSKKRVYLNHKFCSQFCVLGNSSCS